MPRTYQRWIFTKAKEYVPKGTLQIGQILKKPFDPSDSLMPGGPIPVPDSILEETSFQTAVDIDSKEDLSAIFALWLNIVGLPIGTKAGASTDRSNELSWHFDKVTAKIISPSLKYINQSLNHSDVPTYTKRFHWTRRLYIVIGVRTVYSARIQKKASQFKGLYQGIEADISEVIPAKVGVKAEVAMSSENKESFKNASDFVYAYRLNEVNYWGTPTHKPYVKGKVQGEGGREESEGGSDQEEGEFIELNAGSVKGDFDGEGFDGVQKFTLVSVQDPEVEYKCLMAKTE